MNTNLFDTNSDRVSKIIELDWEVNIFNKRYCIKKLYI